MTQTSKQSQRKPKITADFSQWPAKVQAAFEAYYALPAVERSAERVGEMGLYGTTNTVRGYSSRYGWLSEVARRDKQAADEQREATRKSRSTIIENFETGIGNLASAYASAMSGICPRCRGKGKRGNEEVCGRCGGTGEADPLRVNTVSIARLALLLDKQWGDTRSGDGEEVRGALTHEEYMRLQREMLEQAGEDAAEEEGEG